LAYDLEKSGLEFAAFVNNVADKQRQLFAYDLVKSGGYTLNAYDKPRWFGVSVRKKF
jgi:outer membrane receptor protein involved in Fe transport